MEHAIPDIPPQTLTNWQRIVDLIARLSDVPASLVMRSHPPHHSVHVSSAGGRNPYAPGQRFTLNARLYCQGVMQRDGELVVEEDGCRHGHRWRHRRDRAGSGLQPDPRTPHGRRLADRWPSRDAGDAHFCAEHDIVCDVEMIGMQDINEAWRRVQTADLKYRFVIDMASLNGDA